MGAPPRGFERWESGRRFASLAARPRSRAASGFPADPGPRLSTRLGLSRPAGSEGRCSAVAASRALRARDGCLMAVPATYLPPSDGVAESVAGSARAGPRATEGPNPRLLHGKQTGGRISTAAGARKAARSGNRWGVRVGLAAFGTTIGTTGASAGARVGLRSGAQDEPGLGRTRTRCRRRCT
jgi:hypothetical protein